MRLNHNYRPLYVVVRVPELDIACLEFTKFRLLRYATQVLHLQTAVTGIALVKSLKSIDSFR